MMTVMMTRILSLLLTAATTASVVKAQLSASQDCAANGNAATAFDRTVLMANSQGPLSSAGILIFADESMVTSPSEALSTTMGVGMNFNIIRQLGRFTGFLIRVAQASGGGSNPFIFYVEDNQQVGTASFCGALGLLNLTSINLTNSLQSAAYFLYFEGSNDFDVTMDVIIATTTNPTYEYYFDTFNIRVHKATQAPSSRPSISPTVAPTSFPSASPTLSPSTVAPTAAPTSQPSFSSPTASPSTDQSSKSPTNKPSSPQTRPTTRKPTFLPTRRPTQMPSFRPTKNTVAPNRTGSGSTSALTDNITPSPNNGVGSGNFMVVAALAGVAALLLIALLAIYWHRRNSHKKHHPLDKLAEDDISFDNNDSPPPKNTKNKHRDSRPTAELVIGDDEVSALYAPSVDGEYSYDAEQSMSTVDYDYAKVASGGGNRSVVSSAGGTLGGDTRQDSLTHVTPATALEQQRDGGSGKWAKLGPRYSDESNIYTVPAPAGKLGVVVDTPDEGPPVIHAVKDTSVLHGKVNVGDRLLAVDGEDVSGKSAIDISRLIAKKSGNPVRNFTLMRAAKKSLR